MKIATILLLIILSTFFIAGCAQTDDYVDDTGDNGVPGDLDEGASDEVGENILEEDEELDLGDMIDI